MSVTEDRTLIAHRLQQLRAASYTVDRISDLTGIGTSEVLTLLAGLAVKGKEVRGPDPPKCRPDRGATSPIRFRTERSFTKHRGSRFDQVHRWLARIPLHFTPTYSSWRLNRVGR